MIFPKQKHPLKVLLKLVIMSLRGIANGDAVAIPRKGNLVIKPKTINAILSAFTNFRT